MSKKNKLRAMMARVSRCRLCCEEGNGIAKNKLLRNLIAENPKGPRYGEIPTMYSDWSRRLDAKIAIVLQDWGSAQAALKLRAYYENLISRSVSRTEAWCRTVRERPLHLSSNTHRNIIDFLKSSARLERVRLPDDFLDRIFFTNAILCFKRGNSSDKGIDLRSSIENCCLKQRFLRDQLAIVNPAVVVALGKWSLYALGFPANVPMRKLITQVRRASRSGYQRIQYHDLEVCVVPAFHPVARPKDCSRESQIDDYRFIWRALADVLGVPLNRVARVCF